MTPDPTPFYHYQSFEEKWLEVTLRDKTVHFSTADSFNDPWDSKLWFQTENFHDPVCRSRAVEFLKRMVGNEAILADALEAGRDNVDFIREMVANTARESYTRFNEHWRIYCLTHIPDSNLMWAHYGRNHTGICLEFSAQDRHFTAAKPVHYQSAFPNIEISDVEPKLSELFLTKDKCWDYEEEWRILARERKFVTKPWDGVIVDNQVLKLNPGALRAIIVGCKGPYDRIKAVVDKYAPDIRVRRAVQKMNEYKLAIED